MTKSRKKRDHFSEGIPLGKEKATGKHLHDVLIVKKVPKGSDEMKEEKREELPGKYQSNWYLKEAFGKLIKDKIHAAEREVVAQEFFRLLIPDQPKTRLVFDYDDSGSIVGVSIASKEIPGYKKITSEEDLIENIQNGTCTGLGEVTLVSLLLDEVDLKYGNMALDENNRIIKFDGDWCFSYLRDRNHTVGDINFMNIHALPMSTGGNVYNWLSVIHQGVCQDDSSMINLLYNKKITLEVNRTILKILLLPKDLIENFVASYVEDDAHKDIILNEIIRRQEQILEATEFLPDFEVYMKTPEAEADRDNYIAYLKSFKTSEKNKIITTEDTIKQVCDSFDKLRKKVMDEEFGVENVFPPSSELSHNIGEMGFFHQDSPVKEDFDYDHIFEHHISGDSFLDDPFLKAQMDRGVSALCEKHKECASEFQSKSALEGESLKKQ